MSQWSLTFEVRKRAPGGSPKRPNTTSQWSLTFEVRKSSSPNRPERRQRRVAMEPDL